MSVNVSPLVSLRTTIRVSLFIYLLNVFLFSCNTSRRPDWEGFQKNTPGIPTCEDGRFAGDPFPSSGQSELRPPLLAAAVRREAEAVYRQPVKFKGAVIALFIPPLIPGLSPESLPGFMSVTVRNLTHAQCSNLF